MNLIYKRKSYNIYRAGKNQYIVHNTEKPFSNGHTHINNYYAAKKVLQLALTKTLPTCDMSKYLLESIIRISIDTVYINQIKMML